MRYNMTDHLMPLVLLSVSDHAKNTMNSTTAFLSFKKIAIWYWCWCHVMPTTLVSALCDVDSTISGMIAFFKSRWLKWGKTWLFWSCATIGTSHAIHVMVIVLLITQLHFLGQGNWNEMQHEFLVNMMPVVLASASHYPNGIINGTIPFISSRWLKWVAIWLFSQIDHWCRHWHNLFLKYLEWYHCISWIKVIEIRGNMTFLVMWPNNVVNI